MENYDLRSYSNGYFNNYNDTVDPTISNVFAGAAFRFAHTLLPVSVLFITIVITFYYSH